MLRDVAELLIEQPESGSISYQGNNLDDKIITRVYRFNSVYMNTVLGSIEKNDIGLGDDGYLKNITIRKDVAYPAIYLDFSPTASTGENPNTQITTNSPKHYLSWRQENIPLNRLDNYRINWDYILAAKSGTSSSPSWWLTKTNLEMSDADAQKYQWIKDSSQLKTGWYILLDAQKKGQEEKLHFEAVINEEVWTRTIYNALNFAETETKKKTPSKTLGVSGGQWLVQPSQIAPEGDYFRVSTQYLHASLGWDSDIYG